MVCKSIKRNYFLNLLYELISIITPLLLTPYVSRVLGASGIGAYSYATATVSYFTLFATFGSTTYANREIGGVQENKQKFSICFWNILLTRFILTVLAVIGYAIYLLKSERDKIFIFVFFLNIINVAFDISWFFQGIEEFTKIFIRNIIVKIINVILILTLIRNSNDVIIYAVIMNGCTVLGSVLLWPYVPKYIAKVEIKNIHFFVNFKKMFYLFLPTIAIQVYTILDKSMICWSTGGTIENGYYEQAEKLVKSGLVVITTLGTVMLPRISLAHQKGLTSLVKDYIYKSFQFCYFLALPFCFGLCSIADKFVPLYFGCGWDKVIVLISLFSLLFIIIGTSNILGKQYLIPTYRQNTLTLSVFCGAILNVVLNMILIPRFNSVGACVASVVAECVVLLTQLIFVLRNNLLSFRLIVLSIWKYLFASVVMSFFVLIVKRLVYITISSLIIIILSASVVYVVVLIILQDSLLMESIKFSLQYLLKIGENLSENDNKY